MGGAEISSLVTGLFVMVVLLALTKVFLYMPNNAQGAIIISGIITLFGAPFRPMRF